MSVSSCFVRLLLILPCSVVISCSMKGVLMDVLKYSPILDAGLFVTSLSPVIPFTTMRVTIKKQKLHFLSYMFDQPYNV